MRRLYFLAPDVKTAKTIVDELLLARIEVRYIHVLAREGTPMADLPEAGLSQKSDLVPALERGIAIGGMAGVVAGVVAVTFPPAGLVLGGGAILATGLTGAGVGAVMSSMIGVDVPNSRLKQFEEAIGSGKLLLMVDVPKDRVGEIQEKIRQHHPEAEIGGTEPTIPPFP
ncbi:DUF1269 domain-containing protein [Thiohalobacter thiocyanaticus]|uniref:DUF1269 domain-containing protein n=1 Tax=Thiohalobacter thiocyanaticus TaxID=585455 RepID=A0A426QIK9_9GAMM|nr:DUF1269 domain-containing protein [Thiohalobacter thiocyanaticus]RRQ21570.1 DUF1269 domain-containing protein [Thiohalobacter thiocyanaticus]